MKSNIPTIQPETFYHIYNRGINGENVFKTFEYNRGINGENVFKTFENYSYFLNKYSNFIPSVADTYSYCLLKNHFHLLIKTKSETIIKETFNFKKHETASLRISLQFSHLFNGYSQGINKATNRTGNLFETPFRRIEISDEFYLRRLVFYIHFNPEKHKLCSDFRTYPYCSYASLLSDKITQLKRDETLSWFGGKDEFILFHSDLKNLVKTQLEFD